MDKQLLGALGQVVIFDDYEDMKLHIDPITVQLASGDLVPGEMTTVGGYWAAPLKFVGVLRDNPMVCVFYVGVHANIFENCILCDTFYRIHHDRIFKKYTDSSGRDHNWINGRWK